MLFGGARIVIRFGNIGPQRLLGPPTTSSTVAVHTYVNDWNAEKPGCPRQLWWGFLHTLNWWYFAHFGWWISHGDDILTPQSRSIGCFNYLGRCYLSPSTHIHGCPVFPFHKERGKKVRVTTPISSSLSLDGNSTWPKLE